MATAIFTVKVEVLQTFYVTVEAAEYGDDHARKVARRKVARGEASPSTSEITKVVVVSSVLK